MRERKRKRIIFQLSSSSARRDQFLILFYSSFSLFLSPFFVNFFSSLFIIRPSLLLRRFSFDPTITDWITLLLRRAVLPRYSVLLFIEVHRLSRPLFHLLRLRPSAVRPSNIMLSIGLIAKILNDFLPPKGRIDTPVIKVTREAWEARMTLMECRRIPFLVLFFFFFNFLLFAYSVLPISFSIISTRGST